MLNDGKGDIHEGWLDEAIDERHTIAQGKVFTYERLDVTLPDGSKSIRDVVRLPGGSAVVALDQEGYVYLVAQYRAAIGQVSLELPAGRLEPGEEPGDCAARELMEEAGLRAGSMKLLTSIVPSPGYSDEVLYIYLATDLVSDEACPDEGEFLKSIIFPFDEVVDLVATGEIRDSKTVVGILLAERELRLGPGSGD